VKRQLVFYILAFLLCFHLGLIKAEDEVQGPDRPGIGEESKISLSLRNIDIIEALKFFSMRTGLNIIPTQQVLGRVTLTVENVRAKDVFDIMLRSNSLAYDKRGDIYNIMTEAQYKALYGKNFSDTRQVKVFRLKYAIPEQAFSLLDATKSDIGRLLVEPESGTVMLMDTPQKIEDAAKTLKELEKKNMVKVFNLKYAKAKDVEDQLKTQLDLKKVGMIKADERTNQVMVQTLPERMQNIEQLINSLDKKTRAVMIDTKIIKIKLSDQRDTGIQWEGLFNLAKNAGMTYLGSYPFSAVQASTAAWRSRPQVVKDMAGNVGSYPFSGTVNDGGYSKGTKVSPGEKMHVGIIDGKSDFDVVIKYLQTLGKTKILANPTITVVNNQEAKIHVGERRAYVTTTTTTGTTTNTVSEEITYIDIGVRLSITPMINEDGYITMKVKPEISNVIGNIESASNNMIPIIDTSSAETTVMAKDGSTVLLGGLGKEEKTESAEQVPVLGKIPFLGFLFRSKTQKIERTELLIMVTPYIYEGDALATPADKQKEKFGVKPEKEFDIYRPQGFVDQGVSVPVKDKEEFAAKEFKSYNVNTIKEEPALATAAGVPAEVGLAGMPAATEGFAPKELKPYNVEEIKGGINPAAGTPGVTSLGQENKDLFLPDPKGFRSYSQ
jgi:type II secretory pathway component GspD/PulD (secretin)